MAPRPTGRCSSLRLLAVLAAAGVAAASTEGEGQRPEATKSCNRLVVLNLGEGGSPLTVDKFFSAMVIVDKVPPAVPKNNDKSADNNAADTGAHSTQIGGRHDDGEEAGGGEGGGEKTSEGGKVSNNERELKEGALHRTTWARNAKDRWVAWNTPFFDAEVKDVMKINGKSFSFDGADGCVAGNKVVFPASGADPKLAVFLAKAHTKEYWASVQRKLLEKVKAKTQIDKAVIEATMSEEHNDHKVTAFLFIDGLDAEENQGAHDIKAFWEGPDVDKKKMITRHMTVSGSFLAIHVPKGHNQLTVSITNKAKPAHRTELFFDVDMTNTLAACDSKTTRTRTGTVNCLFVVHKESEGDEFASKRNHLGALWSTRRWDHHEIKAKFANECTQAPAVAPPAERPENKPSGEHPPSVRLEDMEPDWGEESEEKPDSVQSRGESDAAAGTSGGSFFTDHWVVVLILALVALILILVICSCCCCGGSDGYYTDDSYAESSSDPSLGAQMKNQSDNLQVESKESYAESSSDSALGSQMKSQADDLQVETKVSDTDMQVSDSALGSKMKNQADEPQVQSKVSETDVQMCD